MSRIIEIAPSNPQWSKMFEIQRWSWQRTAMRIIVMDKPLRGQGIGGHFLKLCERWLKQQGIEVLQAESAINKNDRQQVKN